MNYPSESFTYPSSSSEAVPGTAAPYSDPSHTMTTFPFHTPGTGLGISMQGPGSHLRPYASENYVTDWSSNFLPSTLSSAPLNTGHLSPATGYDAYSGSDASASPLSYCGPHTMSASSSRGSALDFGPSQNMLNTQAYNFWPNTPGSDVSARLKETSDHDYQQTSYLGNSKHTAVPLFAPIPQARVNRYSPNIDNFEESNIATTEVVDSDVDYSLPMEASEIPDEVISKWIKESVALPNAKKRKIESASGLECTICGAQFTRRSNCREHIKRHDPNSRKSYPCEHCGKTLGRKTDLKRHIESVHQGVRRHGCEQCGQHFSRQDTLARWLQTNDPTIE
ncbi:hypothetical protein BJX99DRAFT_250678 [Aspergillus californicus]